MEYMIGDVIGEFKKSGDPDGGYTRELNRLYLVKGRIPASGGWQIICLDDLGYEKGIPEKEIEAGNGHYIKGGERIVLHQAGLDEEALPWADLRELRREA